jgi:probable F420-dependent oxidoreductase
VTAEQNQLRVGLVAPGDLVRASALEDLPIDSLWTGGHVASPNPSPEALMALARLSAITERVQIGTSILLLPLYPPAIVAKQIADLDRATGGRMVLGVGVGGEYPQEFSACGVPIVERGRRADEAIPLLRRLWSGEQISHNGRFYPMADVRIHPRPDQTGGPPIIVAGRKEPAMRRAALLGDGWMPYLYSPRRYGSSVARIREMADEAGRDLPSFEWYAFIFVHIDRDGRRARQEAARMMGGTYDQDFGPMVDHVAAAGTPEEVLEKIEQFVGAGARHLIFLPATTRTDDFDPIVGHLFEDVLPRLGPRNRSVVP